MRGIWCVAGLKSLSSLLTQQPIPQAQPTVAICDGRGLWNGGILQPSWISFSRKSTSVSGSVIERQFGQPSSLTHPHLIGEEEVIPRISKHELRCRRANLCRLALESYQGVRDVAALHVFLFWSAWRSFMSNDIPYPFRQDSNFLYLSGFQEPGSMLVIHTTPANKPEVNQSVLFVQPKNLHAELWEGPRSGTDGAVQLTGVDYAYDVGEVKSYFSHLHKQHDRLVLWSDRSFSLNQACQSDVLDEIVCENGHRDLEETSLLVHQMRVRKSPAEIRLMTDTVRVASEAFVDVMKYSRCDVLEADLAAKMEFECRIRGAQFLAYPPVVAGGSRANTIHYTANNRRVGNGELVLMDAGCEMHGYTSDITRTWPANGRFSPAQREMYEALLEVQVDCIELCTKHHSLDDVHRQMLLWIGKKIRSLGMVPRNCSLSDASAKAAHLCPHHVGHYLGMDVHDVDKVTRSVKLMPDTIVTIEPGLYIQTHDLTVPEKFRGIGIRIEDNILVTDGAPVNLSADCPKTVGDIERVLSCR